MLSLVQFLWMVGTNTAPLCCAIYGICTFCYSWTWKGAGGCCGLNSLPPCQRRKCNAVSNLFLETVTKIRKLVPQKEVGLHKTLFSNPIFSHWYGNIPFLFCAMFDINSFKFTLTLSGFQALTSSTSMMTQYAQFHLPPHSWELLTLSLQSDFLLLKRNYFSQRVRNIK